MERKLGCGVVVQNVPRTELQLVRSHLQLRYIIICGAGGVRTEVVLEVVVERVGHLHLAVDDELHVVSDASS